ncbi:hypothetical protein QYE76_013420 [Lolium multiflorum]|uniref:Uncharacterized protein n=1 Tax=Lolium multiflorum TaxID=4521 RepID=A0AAD8X4J6_LOLMU|nr:hypothetical protein QYE76_013420 [Lolium multiflorum]
MEDAAPFEAKELLISGHNIPGEENRDDIDDYIGLLQYEGQKARDKVKVHGAPMCGFVAPKKKLSHGGLWGSNPQDFVKQAQSRKVFHLVVVKIVIIKLKWNAQDMSTPPPQLDPILATCLASAPPPLIPVHMDPTQGSSKSIDPILAVVVGSVACADGVRCPSSYSTGIPHAIAWLWPLPELIDLTKNEDEEE